MQNVYLYVCVCVHICKIDCIIDDHRLATFMWCYCLEHRSWIWFLISVSCRIMVLDICRISVLIVTNITQLSPAQYPTSSSLSLCWMAACRPPETWLETHWTNILLKKESSSCSLWITSLVDWNALLHLAGQHLHPWGLQYFVYCPFSNRVKIFQ